MALDDDWQRRVEHPFEFRIAKTKMRWNWKKGKGEKEEGRKEGTNRRNDACLRPLSNLKLSRGGR